MKILKRILFSVLGLVALLLIIALFVKKDYAVEREITINKPKQEVFAYVKSLRNQNSFSKWGSMDPNMKTSYTGTDGTVGSVSAWQGNSDVGTGEQEIKKITEGERIDFELRFKDPIEVTNYAYMTTEAVSNKQTKVKWAFNGKTPYPFNLMCLVMDMDQMIGGDLEVGLSNLKKQMEK
jgi:uncharacterized protein YndB with AHSA1/START domain